ncbi:hypothetical protein OX283_011950 [Flavobacterium sp. SUN052]|uniref:hypothetical protein n=1 Tax=Flavobacterium sp. SUN052 TaxID=3002441 RepID=UPI00237D56C4|nr:hypothetical protein [Flavobacterium sp. SUN052]MEC4005372.1 hypothetical protein [Flavobacterium sp. SUN052]
MKQILIMFLLIIFSNSIFGQYALSKDAIDYLKNEKKYNRKSPKIIKDILKRNNKSLFIDSDTFKIIPTFRAKENYLMTDLDSFLSSIEIDKNILWNEILIIQEPNKNFKSYEGCSFCESSKCDVYLYDDSPERYQKYNKAVEKFIINGNFDFIFKVEHFSQFWFLLKDNQLSLYSFLNETLYTGKDELQMYIKNYI